MGEFELLAKLRERLPRPGPRVLVGSGDDAAVTVPGGATATSVDAVVDGVHFRRESAALRQVGAKALAAALSDLAAMGAEPGEAYVALGVPPDLGEDDCLALLDGLLALAGECGTDLAGGDVTRAPALSLAVTVVGHAAEAESFVTRAGARAGDALAVTGELGGAAAGLLLLDSATTTPPRSHPRSYFDPLTGQKYDRGAGGGGSGEREEEERERLLRRQLEPRPRLAEGRALARAGARAMIDLSDGLAGDAAHLARASGVGLRIEAAALPLAAGVEAVAAAAGRDPLELAIGGGEDYELLVALPRERLAVATTALRELGTALTPIGAAVAGEGVEIRLPDGRRSQLAGYDQLGRARNR